MFAAAEQFGLNEEDLRQAADLTLAAIGDDATVPEYFDELAGVLARRILAKQPNILALVGAASAEYGIGKVYKALDSEELVKFLENEATFHSQFQRFGNVEFQQTPRGGRMIYTNYPVYSPIYCASAVGFFLEAILRHGGHDPAVIEARCQCHGQQSCTYELTWK